MQYFFVILLIILFLLFFFYQNNKLDITYYDVKSNTVEKDLKIIHLSDFHSKPFKAVLRKVKNEKPDIICITGDYINDHNKNRAKMLEYGKELLAISPVYYITGNHERRLDSFNALMNELSDIGFIVLLNQVCQTEFGAILGLDENMANFDDYKTRKEGKFIYKNMKPYFDELDKFQGFKLVLSHFPENFEEIKALNYSQYSFDIQLSGHAHGGQWIMPFIGPLFSPGQGIFPKYARGSFGSKPKLIVSRGLGNSEFPIRLFNHPEIVVVKIKKQNIS